ncbi:low molecular weight protein tyrosine phosphatase family protein [Microbaculum marinisediminis]|uniref:Phosphotyrosine protein phosphatase n=1 Tax=Microbaculum marinisediminis TaxID=2931392 RepID=A0AAW5QRW1_9HYPH|nr:phosphotyrosine protein phosphatase [Microbaculum sp. A6E488]MCT8970796.1 phosphotyrosine protein phosphatase [Microbaculum sp. A6E488]
MRVLFVCTANKLRSPTAESVFRDYPGIESLSAGTDPHAPTPLSKELIESVDLIIAMETHHRERIRKKYKQRPADGRIITLHIPDEYERDDPALIELLKKRAGPVIRQYQHQTE